MNLITTFMFFYICFSLFRIKLECQRFILESGWKGNQLVELVLCKLAVVQIYSFFAKDARKLQKSYLKDEEKKDNKKKRVCITYPFFLFPSALLPVSFAASIKFPKSSQNSVI